jgi:protein involved in polysaccharide export with SLBB domain
MRHLICLTGALACLCSATAFGQTVYRLQPGDNLQVWVAQEDSLNREIAVAPDGWVSFPMVGHIKAEGLSVSELEAAMLDRLGRFFQVKPNLTVMLRPNPRHEPLVYVNGEVAKPGSYPYRPGMTVIHCLSLAGGIYRTTLGAADQDRSVVVRQDIAASEQRLQELKARMERLETELAGGSKLTDKEADGAQNRFEVQEQTLLDAHQQTLKTQESAKQQYQDLAKKTAQALAERVDIVTRQIALSRQRLERLAALVEKGGVQSSQQVDKEIEIAEREGQLSQLLAAKADAERAQIAENARFDNLLQEKRSQMLVDLHTTRREYEQAQLRLADSKRILAIYDAAARANGKGREIVYSILRPVDGNLQEIDVEETAPVQDGDVVKVTYRSADSSPQVSQVQQDEKTPLLAHDATAAAMAETASTETAQ